MRISVIIPTIGRSSLSAAVASVTDQKRITDQLIVVGDGKIDTARDLLHGMPGVIYVECQRKGDWGSTPIDYGISIASGDFLAFLGDDDELKPDGMAIMHEATDAHAYHSVHLFGADFCGRSLPGFGDPPTSNFVKIEAVLDNQRKIETRVGHCHVTGQQIVVPNRPEFLPSYATPHPQGLSNDWAFVEEALKRAKAFGYGIFIDTRQVVRIPQQNGGRMF